MTAFKAIALPLSNQVIHTTLHLFAGYILFMMSGSVFSAEIKPVSIQEVLNESAALKPYQQANLDDILFWNSTEQTGRTKYIVKTRQPFRPEDAKLTPPFIPQLFFFADVLNLQPEPYARINSTGGAIDKYLFDGEDHSLHFLFGEYREFFNDILAHGCKSFDKMTSIISSGKINGQAYFSNFILEWAASSAGNFGPFYVLLNHNVSAGFDAAHLLDCTRYHQNGIDSDGHLIYLVPNKEKANLIANLKDQFEIEQDNKIKANIENGLTKIYSFRDLINLAIKNNWPILNSLKLEELLNKKAQ